MSFQEKSIALMVVIMVVEYGWYFTLVVGQLDTADVGGFPHRGYQGPLLVTVVALVILAVVGHILFAVLPPHEEDRSDERDHLVNMRGEMVGGYVLGTAAFAALVLAMIEAEYFWIANSVLLGLVLSEVVAGVTKLALYRRMA